MRLSTTTRAELTDREIAKLAEEAYISADPMLDNLKVTFALAIHQDSPAYYLQERQK